MRIGLPESTASFSSAKRLSTALFRERRRKSDKLSLPNSSAFRYQETMRAVLQRVSSASVTVDSEEVSAIARGLLVLVGVEEADSAEDVEWIAGRITTLRLFPEGEAGWARSVTEIGGEILLVSQFTLHASTRKGTKPSWHRAAKPQIAVPLYEALAQRLEALLGRPVGTGRFGAMMKVALVNDGPVTVLIDSKNRE